MRHDSSKGCRQLGLPPRPSLGRAVREPRMHHRPQRTRTGNRARPFLHRLRIPYPFADSGIVLPPELESGGKEPTPERIRARGYEEEERREVAGCTPVPCVCCPASEFSRHFLYSSYFHIVRPPRVPDKDAGAGQRQRAEVRARLTVSASRILWSWINRVGERERREVSVW